MINNINTLQHLTQGSGLTTYSDLYLKQSLANLGQRYSIKGDGIQTGEFHLCDLFGREYVQGENLTSHMSVNVTGEKTNPSIILSYIDNGEVIDRLPLEGVSYYKTVEQINLDGSPINGVDHYKAGGVIYKTTDNCVTNFVGIDSNNEIVEIVSNRIYLEKHTTNTLEHYDIRSGFRIRYADDSKTSVKLYNIKTVENSHPTDHNYLYEVYKFNVPYSLEEIEDLLFGNSVSSVITGHETEATPEYIVNILANTEISQVTHVKLIEKEYDLGIKPDAAGNGTVTSTVNSDKKTVIFNATPKANHPFPDVDFEEATRLLNMFAYDINVFFPYINKYYSDHVYFSNNSNLALKKQLFVSIVKKLYEYFIDKNIYDTPNEFNMWLPYNYKFVYSCNDNNASKIFNSIHNVTVQYTVNIDQMISRIVGSDPEQIIICESTDEITIEDKIGVYQYSIIYDTEDVVNSIIVDRVYTLPYIDNNGYWCINDITTDIYARGKDGGQPNIIITYTDTAYVNTSGKHYDVLSSFKRDEITNLDWSTVQCMVKPLDADNNTGVTRYHILNTMMPTNINHLNENLISFLENAVILNVNSVNSEVFEECKNSSYLYNNLGTTGVIPTFWVLQKIKKVGAKGSSKDDYDYKFAYVQQPGEPWAIDMNYLSNAEKIVKHYMQLGIEPDNYEHTWLVFDSISTDLKNSTNEKTANVWPVIRNVGRQDIVTQFGEYDESNPDKYNNDLNMFVGFFDQVLKTENTGYVASIGQSDLRYFFLDNSGKTSRVINYINYKNEFVPNAYYTADGSSLNGLVPIFDLGEVFVRNETVLNRINIMSVDKDKNVFNAYFGVSYSSPIKNVIHLGTSHTNPNIGNQTLLVAGKNSYFQKHDELSIDFDSVSLGGDFVLSKPMWVKDNGGDNKVSFSTTATPVSLHRSIVTVSDLTEATNEMYVQKRIETFSGSKYTDQKVYHDIAYLNLTYYFQHNLGINICSTVGSGRNPTTFNSRNSAIYFTTKTSGDHSDITYFIQLRNNPVKNNKNWDENNYIVGDPLALTYYIYGTNDFDDKPGALRVNVNEIATPDIDPIYFNGNI